MSFRPRPRFLNLGVGRPRLGARGQTNELSQLISTRPTTTIQSSSFTKSRLSSSTPLSHGSPRPRSHQYHQKQHNHSSHYRQQQTRHNSTNSNSNPNPNQQARIDRLLTRLPRFLHPYLSSLRSSPSSFVIAFLILHEITAVVPGSGFFYLFHYYDADTGSDEESGDADGDGESGKEGKGKGGSFGRRFENWIMGWMMEHGYSEVMMGKMEGFERWFRRKGYFGFGKEDDLSAVGREVGKKNEGEGAGGGERGGGEEERVLMRKWQSGDEKYRVLVDAALAYAITKALLPVRIIVSVQATPWFAGVLGRVRRVFGGGLRK